MKDLHYLLAFNHCNKKRCAVLFGDLKNTQKFELQKKLENTLLDASSEMKDLISLNKNKELNKEINPSNERYVYKLLEHLDPTVTFSIQ